MASTLPPDPYKALGLSKDVDSATIKSTYRKLALKCHPDKVNDESLKKQKQEEFHKIQQAYELIGDEDKRATYDAEARLDFLRREKLSRGEPRVDIKTARYEVRTPAGTTFTASAPPRYDDRKTSRSFEEDRYWDDRARKFDTYDPYPKHSSSTRTSRSEKDPAIRVRVSSDRTRSDHKKTRDREERRDRSGKFVYPEEEISSNDEKVRFETSWHRRSDEDDAKKAAADARRKAEDHRRSYEEPQHDRQRKLSDQTSEAMNHIQFTKGVVDPRPPTVRTSSSREIRPETHDRSSRRDRPESVRRSSARPKEHRDRDRKAVPEIVEWRDDDVKVPSFKHSSSSPADIHVPSSTRATPQRAYTEAPREHRRTESSPTPAFRRSETMPSVSHSSSSRKATAPRSSTLRSSETLAHHEPLSRSPETTYPTIPPPQPATQPSSSKKYYYSTSSGGVRLVPAEVEVANGHRTILHEPNRHRTRSPSPLSRPPMGPNAPQKLSVPPPLGRSATLNVSSSHGDDRGRSRPALYGEIPKRENARRQPSYSPEAVAYSRKIGPDDIRWSRGRDSLDRDREYARPTLTRPATFAY